MTYNELLKQKYNIDHIGNENEAKKLFKQLESLDSNNFYEYNDEGKISGFYSKIMLKHVLENFKIININGSENDNYIYKDGIYKKSEELKSLDRKSVV